MSWSIQASGTAEEVADKVAGDDYLPAGMKEYIGDGIEALQKRHGGDVKVVVSGHGHLHNGEEGNYDVTSATIEVKKASE